MAVTKLQKESILKKFQRTDLDTGSPEVQVAILTARINDLTKHFSTQKNDKHSMRGMVRAVNQRRKLLDYIKRTDVKRYESLIKELEIRR